MYLLWYSHLFAVRPQPGSWKTTAREHVASNMGVGGIDRQPCPSRAHHYHHGTGYLWRSHITTCIRNLFFPSFFFERPENKAYVRQHAAITTGPRTTQRDIDSALGAAATGGPAWRRDLSGFRRPGRSLNVAGGLAPQGVEAQGLGNVDAVLQRWA